MKLSDFDYQLPKDLIAQTPASPRDHSRLMVINRATEEISHHHFYELPSLLPNNYQLVANNTKVFPARLVGNKPTGAKVEILLLKKLPHSRFECIVSPGLKPGQTIIFNLGLTAEVKSQNDRLRVIKFSQTDPALTETISTLGVMPTPPYIKQMLQDDSKYQTIYAKYGFSAAAPTAGLHFTKDLLSRVKSIYNWSELTLDVGLGTFLPVQEDDITTHAMHKEHYRITPTLSKKLLSSSDPLCVIGTTTLRALESNPNLNPGYFDTEIFIYPPFKFKRTSALITNFHLPKSTLLMLVSAFASYPNTNHQFTTFKDSLIGRAYQLAIQEKYRFFSFGDAMLIL